jgi:hypothetical protein
VTIKRGRSDGKAIRGSGTKSGKEGKERKGEEDVVGGD